MHAHLIPLAVTTTGEALAYKVGEVVGMVFAIAVLLAIPVAFVLCLVKFAKTKKRSWLVGTLICSLPILAFVGIVLFGVYQGVKTGLATVKPPITATPASPGLDRVVEIPDSGLAIELPGHWNIMDDLNEEAELGAGNPADEQYLVVLVESKQDFAGALDKYADLTSSFVIDGLTNARVEGPEEKNINGLPAIARSITGTHGTTNICYTHTVFEGEESFIQVIAWTLPSRQAEAFPILEKAVSSISSR